MQLSASLPSFFFKCGICASFSSDFFFLFIFMISLGLLNWKRRTDADTLQPFHAVPYREITFRLPFPIHIYLKATSCVLYPKYTFLFIKTVWHSYLWKCPSIYVTRWRADTILNANSYHMAIYWSNRVKTLDKDCVPLRQIHISPSKTLV